MMEALDIFLKYVLPFIIAYVLNIVVGKVFSKKRLSGKIHLVFLKGIIKPLAALPVPVRVKIGRAIGSLIPSFATKDCTIAKLQLEWIFPELNADKLVPKVFANMES